jgi:hypothetical protein
VSDRPVDWSVLDVESRAAIPLGQQFTTPKPVIHVTPEGFHPLGDPTRWGGSDEILVQTGGVGIVVPSQQLVRAQVLDHRARNWRWQLQLQSFPVADINPSLNLANLQIEWTVGIGQVSVVQRFDLAPFTLTVGVVLGWTATLTATGDNSIWFRSFHGFTDILAEALSARLIFTAIAGEGPTALRFSPRMMIQPTAVGS